MRKKYLDNIRWITVLFVVVFHIFFYYNNIGTEPLFEGEKAFSGKVTFAGIFQYFVYPWFMLLLFVVAGMSAKYALEKKTEKQFLKGRIDKLFVPSTLGVLAFGWIGGYVLYIHTASVEMPASVPMFVRIIIIIASGIGALWFCHVLFLSSLILLLVRKIIKKVLGEEEKIKQWLEEKEKSSVFVIGLLFFLYLILWGGSHVLNMPVITSYRNGIYIPAFLFGYYIFSMESLIEKLKKFVLPSFLLCVLTGIFYIGRCYGEPYTDAKILARWDLNLYAFLMVVFLLGAGARFLDFTNEFTEYMKKRSFGIYVLHIPVLLVTNYLLIGKNIPMAAVYGIELVSGYVISVVLYEVIRKIPFFRYWILGMKKQN